MPHTHRAPLVLLVALAAVLATVAPARATTVPFLLLVVDGFKFQPSLVLGEPATLVAPNRAIHSIINNAKDPTVIGHATIALWNQTVPANPDPFFGPIRPLGALGVFQFDPPISLQAHLGFIDTPAGARTTIGLMDHFTPTTLGVKGDAFGTWLAGPAQGIAGADADDMVVGGLLVVGTGSFAAHVEAEIDPYFPVFPFTPPTSSVGTPTGLACVLGDCTGSFWGTAALSGGGGAPYRGYTANIPAGVGTGRFLHLGVLHTGGDGYLVVACGLPTAPEASAPLVGPCSLSGSGPILEAVAGGAAYVHAPPTALSTTLEMNAFLVQP